MEARNLLIALLGIAALPMVVVAAWRLVTVPELSMPEWEPGHGRVCTAYVPEHISPIASAVEGCPASHGLYAVDDPTRSDSLKQDARSTTVRANCCPLPLDDVLTGEHFYNVAEECPPESVVTSTTEYFCGSSCLVRCTKINTGRYKLTPPVPGAYWSKKWEPITPGSSSSAPKIEWDAIPAGIRYSVGRLKNLEWDVDGCIGYPFGSLLVGKTGQSCDSFLFSRLLFLDGTPVPMFPLCSDLENPAGPSPRCIE